MGWSAFRKNGLTHHNQNLSVKGYTLFTPVSFPDIHLIDMHGRVVKSWQFDGISPNMAKFLPNGNLFISAMIVADLNRANAVAENDYSDPDMAVYQLGGIYTSLREYDWDGNLIWHYDQPRMHHDFHIFNNGDILFPQWVVIPEDIAATVQGGYRNAERPQIMFGDDLVRINRKGEEVDRWHTWEMLDPVDDPIGPLQSGVEWSHMNSVDVMPDGQFVCSLCENSRVILIDPEERKITWKLGDPTISMQHDATPVPGGNIQIFDNGRNRPLALPYSQIIEVDPKTSEIVWRYKPGVPEQFYSAHISSAQRLSGGNVLICEGATGRLFEVTRTGEIVWEWMSPFVGGPPSGRLYQWLYRAYRFPIDHPAFIEKELDPANYKQVNSAYELNG
ncbi:MAG: aryl-sulfate sulfotransferase [Anaerolineae bacterium]